MQLNDPSRENSLSSKTEMRDKIPGKDLRFFFLLSFGKELLAADLRERSEVEGVVSIGKSIESKESDREERMGCRL